MSSLPFLTRIDAGQELAKMLATHGDAPNTLIFALVRGGVVIGKALADKLHLPLFPYIVRKLGHPHHREYGLGAIAESGSTYLDAPAMQMSGVTWEDLEPVIEEETRELKRRQETYMVKARPLFKGQTIILTDDGAATGGSLFAAIEDLRKAKVKKIIVALPVCPPDTAAKLKQAADEVVILATPANFNAVGQWYLEFPQVEDDEVIEILKKA